MVPTKIVRGVVTGLSTNKPAEITALHCEELKIACCTVECLINDMNIRGVGRCRTPRTTVIAPRSADLVDRRFIAQRPNELRVIDITYASTGEVWLYLACVLDVYSRAIIGWQIATIA